jgi:hypothetical protein
MRQAKEKEPNISALLNGVANECLVEEIHLLLQVLSLLL